MTKKKRIKIPKAIIDDVMFKSDRKCYCGKMGEEIHHIDKNPENNSFDNLVLVCHIHHDDASVTHGIIRRLSPSQIKKKRNELYKINELKYQMKFNNQAIILKAITEENLFKAALNASIVLDIIRIKNEYDIETDWKKCSEILRRLSIYAKYSDFRISYEIIEFLSRASDFARSGMTEEVSNLILNLIIEYFPEPKNSKEKILTFELAKKCAYIAFGIIYDSLIYLNNLSVAGSGLEILKFLHVKGANFKMKGLSQIVLNQYLELEETLDRPERTDLENAKRLLTIYKRDLIKNERLTPHNIPVDLY